ncbi:hypothetical protein BHE74_00047769 [Ensete ventricosum]|nr:hypothetical protein GW17_00028492 [Ensete ventricosum]RWW46311.1 hypothetical protein BHE74_00047769 [Ensete ventricosum]RZS21192.1 hypothetical protein BHM03_00053796 [Ensete ventricosum]
MKKDSGSRRSSPKVIGSLPRVHWELTEDNQELAGNAPRVRHKMTETHRKFVEGCREDHQEEIVYPCIPDPNREDEGGQASSSLAVSTRWISTAKLLQSDLVTLAQREGGE